MSVSAVISLTAEDYEREALAYLHSLPLEHFMEGKPQAVQRSISIESFKALRRRRPDVQWFSEMLVISRQAGQFKKVCPDNMLVIADEPCAADGSFNLELETGEPFMVLEYVSPRSDRKDYDDNFKKYQNDFHVPYCVIFHPGRQDLRVYRHNGLDYDLLPKDAAGRCLIPELDLHIGLLGGWVRFWYQGELLLTLDEVEQLAEERQQELEQQETKLDEQELELRQQETKLQQERTKLQQRDEKIRDQQQQLHDREAALAGLRLWLLSEVRRLAGQAGRTDILEQISENTELAQVQAWMSQLSVAPGQ